METAGDTIGRERVVHAKYVVGADGARSRVRDAIGCTLAGDQANHAWGVMDVLAVTDFPDIRTKCAIQSDAGGNILLIPREGGYLFRMYVDLGEVASTTTALSGTRRSKRPSPRPTRSFTRTRSTSKTSPGTASTRSATA